MFLSECNKVDSVPNHCINCIENILRDVDKVIFKPVDSNKK